MQRLKLRKQQTRIDCGPACLTMVAGYYGYETSISEFSDLVNLNSNGCSMYDMLNACEKIGFDCDGYQASVEEIIEARDKDEIKFPLICHIISEEKMLHFVVVEKIDGKTVTVYDPGTGKNKVDIKKFKELFTGNFMEIVPGEQFKPKKRKSKTIKLVKECITENRKTIIPIYIMAFIALGLELLGTIIYPIIVEYVQNMKWLVAEIEAGKYRVEISLVDIALILIGCYLFKTAVDYIKGKLSIKFSCFMEKKLTENYYNHTLNIGMDKYKRITSGDMIARGNETESITSVFSEALVTVIVDSLVAVIVFVMLLNISIKLLVCLLLTVTIYILIILFYKDKIKTANDDIMRCNSKQISGYKEILDSIKQVKTRRNEDIFFSRLKMLVEETVSKKAKGSKIVLKQGQMFNLVSMVSGILILVFGAIEVRNGRLSLGTLLMFNAMTNLFISPLLSIMSVQTSFRVTEAAIDRLDSIFYYDMTAHKDGEVKLSGDIEVLDLSYGYEENKPIFEDINVHFKKGKSYGIIGKSGTGKSTFADILMGIYKPFCGEVLIDGINVRQLPDSVFKTEIAMVSQESYFYSETIADNLLEGNKVDDEFFYEVCEACKVNEFVRELPMGYDTTMNEGGIGFSSGQKQRLAIAKSLLTKPKILILDEATSNLDGETESSIMEYILSLDLTLICIAHRSQIIDKCEEVYMLKDGALLLV